MLLGLLGFGVLPEITLDGHSTSYYVDNYPVFEDMLPDNPVLEVKYTYNPAPDPINNTGDDPGEDSGVETNLVFDSEIESNQLNVNTGDFLPFVAFANLLFFYYMLYFSYHES